MTPDWPYPSAHEIVTESVVLNSNDEDQFINYSFATTANILWRDELCGPTGDSGLEDNLIYILDRIW